MSKKGQKAGEINDRVRYLVSKFIEVARQLREATGLLKGAGDSSTQNLEGSVAVDPLTLKNLISDAFKAAADAQKRTEDAVSALDKFKA